MPQATANEPGSSEDDRSDGGSEDRWEIRHGLVSHSDAQVLQRWGGRPGPDTPSFGTGSAAPDTLRNCEGTVRYGSASFSHVSTLHTPPHTHPRRCCPGFGPSQCGPVQQVPTCSVSERGELPQAPSLSVMRRRGHSVSCEGNVMHDTGETAVRHRQTPAATNLCPLKTNPCPSQTPAPKPPH